MRRIVPALLALCALVLPAGAPAATAPKPGTFAGSLGAAIPKGAQARVRAVSRTDGTVVDTQAVSRKGAFRLAMPPGAYLVVGTVVPRRGRVLTTKVGVSLKAGQRRTRATLDRRRNRRKAKKPRARRSTARAAFVQERGEVTPGQIAVEIPPLKGSSRNAEWNAVRGGIDDLLITDVVSAERCGITVIEVERRADIIRELEFQQSRYVDPATRVTRNFILGDVEVLGTTADAPGGADNGSVRLRIVDKRTGAELGVAEQLVRGDSFFEDLEQLSGKLVDELCKLTDAYEVTFDVRGQGRFATHSGSGTLRTTLLARRGAEGDGAAGAVWRASGTLVWGDLSGASTTNCVLTTFVPGSQPWSVTILDAGGGQLQVTWTTDDVGAAANSTASYDCPPEGDPPSDPPPIPGLPLVSLLNTGPASFVVPYAGGTQALSGVVESGGDGFFNAGMMTITPKGVARRR